MTVSPAEINDLHTKVRDLRTHLETSKRHLALIESRLVPVEEFMAELLKAYEEETTEEAVVVEAPVEEPEAKKHPKNPKEAEGG